MQLAKPSKENLALLKEAGYEIFDISKIELGKMP